MTPTFPDSAPNNESATWPALSERDLTRLQDLGIAVATYEAFLATFVPNRWDWNTKRPDGCWQSIRKRPIQHRDVLNHLSGHRSIGTRAGRTNGQLTTRHIVLDLDAHDADPYWQRVQILTDAFGPPLLFRSSQSNGRHAYYFLPNPTPIAELFDWRDPYGPGVLSRAMRSLGLLPGAGWVELYPNGCQRLPGGKGFSCGNALRLPFGLDSALLTESGAIPAKAAFHDVMARLANGELPQLSLSQLEAVAARDGLGSEAQTCPEAPMSPPRIDRSRQKRRRPSGRGVASDPQLSHVALFANGLTSTGQTNAALLAVSRQLAPYCANPEAMVEAMLDWFDANHHGHSRTLNQGGWPALRAKALPIAERAWERRCLGPVPTLSPREVHRIRALADHAIRRPNEPISSDLRFKLESLMADTAQQAKQWILAQAVTMAAQVPSEVRDDPEALTAHLTNALLSAWPHAPGGIFTVPLPWALRARTPGISRATICQLFTEMQRSGFVRLTKRYCTTTRSAAQYDMELDFSTELPLAAHVVPWDALLCLMVPRGLRRKTYTEHYDSRITADGGQYATERFGDATDAISRALQASQCWSCAGALRLEADPPPPPDPDGTSPSAEGIP